MPARDSPSFNDSIMPNTSEIPWSELENALHRDPGGRGVASYRYDGRFLDAGNLKRAAESLAMTGRAVAIVTGFAIVDGSRVAAETDGPPGALYLARTLHTLGMEVALISDLYCIPLLEVGCDQIGLPREMIYEFPFEAGGPESPARTSNAREYNQVTDAWVNRFLTSGIGRRLTHLVSIERVGPSHASESIAAQRRAGISPLADFEREVPVDSRDVCHNMRGVPINGYTAKTHRLFETIAERSLPIATIGIGDGGNEIGMGTVPWEVLREAIVIGPGAKTSCRIPADFLVIAGVSNWAGYGLAAAVAALRGRLDVIAPWDIAAESKVIESLVRDGGAVDGVTRLSQPSVDGLSLADYLGTLARIRELLFPTGVI
jgi:hypothetical protein